MPVTTYNVASFANGLVIAEIDVDDNNLRIRKARLINNSTEPVLVEVYKAGVLASDQTVNGGDTISKNLPAALKLSYDAGDPEWGIPPELTMGDIEIHVRWPK